MIPPTLEGRRDFIVAIKDLILGHPPRVELLRYLSELLNSANREQDYCDVLGRLFDLYYASFAPIYPHPPGTTAPGEGCGSPSSPRGPVWC